MIVIHNIQRLKRLLKNHQVVFLRVILVQLISKDIRVYQKKIKNLQNRNSRTYCKRFQQIMILPGTKIKFSLMKSKISQMRLQKMKNKIALNILKMKINKKKLRKLKFQILTAT